MSGTYAAHVQADLRLRILLALAAESTRSLGEPLLQTALEAWGHARSRVQIRAELRFLEQAGAVRIVEAGPILIARLTERGQDHVARRALLDGVRAPELAP